MKFGIIGAGNHAQKRVMPALVKAGHEVSAIYSRDIDKAKKIGLKYLSKPYNDMETFLTGDFDAVYISSPNHLHFDHAIASMKRGKDVLLEKQMTLKTSDAEELVRFAEQNRRTLSVGFHMRFHPAIEAIKKMLGQGKIGNIVYGTGMWAGSSSGGHVDPDRKWWDEEDKSGGGSVMGSGVHVIDTINHVLGMVPERVTSKRSPKKTVIEATECVSMDYSDALFTAISSREMKNPDNSLYIFGTEGSIVARDLFGTEVEGSVELNGEVIEKFKGVNMYEEEVKAFSATRRGQKTVIADGNAGLAVVKIVNGAFDGDYMGKWVDL